MINGAAGEQVSSDHIPRSHEWHRHPYWAVESIRQALSLTPGRRSTLDPPPQQLQPRTTLSSLKSDTAAAAAAAAAAGVVANGNVVVGEMRDQATNTDVTSDDCKSDYSVLTDF